MATHFVQGLKDEVSENTLKKRREYYLKHGVKNVFPCGLLESSSLDITTPYMLRNDGELLKCSDYHPYIKSSYKEDTQQSLYYLFYLHPNFIEWFYNNSLNEETKSNIKKLIYLVDDRYGLGPVISDITRDEENRVLENLKQLKEHVGTEKATCSIKDIVGILWDLTNQEFCRVRTSNYRYKTGGDNGEIYFRISSENFNWFDLIWNICVKYANSIDYITIMKDPQVFGKQFDYIKIKDTKINKLPIKDFIELEDEPLIESQVIKEPSFEHNWHYGRVYATNSTSEMKNAILNSTTALRILYDRKQRFYVYCNVEDYIHRKLLDIAWEFGLYPQYKARWQVTEGHFEDYTTQLIFAPTSLVNETAGASIGEDGYTDRIVYDFGVITGRDENRDECLSSIPLIKSLKNKQIKHEVFDGWESDSYTPRIKVLFDKTKSVSDNLTEDTIKLKNGKCANVSEDCKSCSLFLKLKSALSEVAEEERQNTFKNEDATFSNSGFRMGTKSALAYLDNLYKLEDIFKNNGNKETLQDVEKEIQSIDTQLKNKKSFTLESLNEESWENVDTNNIISLLSKTFGTTDEPQPTAMYVLPNGKFLYTTPLEPSEDCDYEIDEHRNIDDFLFHKGIIEDDRYLEDDGSLFAENVLNFIRFNITDEYYSFISYIQLNEKQPTSQQYDSLLKIFDYVINHDYKYLSVIFDNQYGKQIKLELNDYSSDELLKKIKRFYVSGILTENKNKHLTLQDIFPYTNKKEETQDKTFYLLDGSNELWEIIKYFENDLVLITSDSDKKDVVDKKELTPAPNSLQNDEKGVIIKDDLFDFIDNCLEELYNIKQSSPEGVSFLKLAFSELKEAKIPVGYRYAKIEKNKIYCFRKPKGSGGALRVFFFIKNDKVVCFKAWLKGSKTEENKIINQGVKKYLNYNK